MDKKFTFMEMFAGAGGSHLGFKANGNFRTLLVSDINKDMCETFKYNNSEVENVVCQDIHKLRPREMLEQTGLAAGQLDAMFGGIVCKGFSLAGVRSPTDPRNDLYKEYIRLVSGLRPKIAIIENVPGMASMEILNGKELSKQEREEINDAWNKLKKLNGLKSSERKGLASREQISEIREIENNKDRYRELIKAGSVNVVSDIIRRYNRVGYTVLEPRVLNAVDYGAATERRRLIIVAIRNDLDHNLFRWPKEGVAKVKTVRDALAEIDYSDTNDQDNIPMNHSKKSVERFTYIPMGKNIVEVMDKVPKNLKISSFYSRGCTMRLCWDKPAPTLVPGHSNFPIHPKEHRSITVREAAAIMGFPPEYKFFGSHTKRCEQVGQAVVVDMAQALADSTSAFLKKVAQKHQTTSSSHQKGISQYVSP